MQRKQEKLDPIVVECKLEAPSASKAWSIQIGVPRKVGREWHARLETFHEGDSIHRMDVKGMTSYDVMRYALNIVDAETARISRPYEDFKVDGFLYHEPEEAKNPPPD